MEIGRLSVDDELNYAGEFEHISLARVLIALGQAQAEDSHIEDALRLLAQMLELAESAGWVAKAIEILVLQAIAFEAVAKDQDALAALKRALVLAAPEGYVRTFVDEGEPMARLLRLAADRGVAPDYVQQLLAAAEASMTPVHPSAAPPHIEPLSDREREVLRLLNTDLSSSEIAAELVVSVNTVRTHIKRIYGKLDVHSRYEAVERAKELNLLSA
jgi:LuxR family maltose regulon positive regulatory protein